MKNIKTLSAVSMLLLSMACHAATAPVDYVSTLVGTLSKMSLSTGNTYPATGRPWGTHFWTPQTSDMSDSWTYVYTSDKLKGFKQTHQPSPWMNDYGQFSIMPVTTGPVFKEKDRASWFSHKAETATPYYYSVYLADHDTFVEMTPTERAAAFRITYPEKEMSYLVLDAFDRGSSVKIEGNTITGYSVRNTGGVDPDFKNWFVLVSDTPFEYTRTIDGDHSYAIVGFKTKKGQQVNVRVASSFISLEQAKLNLKELGNGDFDRIRKEGRARWNEVLGRVEVQDDNVDNLRTFYSCLYRSVLFPRDFSEIDAHGKRVHYSPHDGKVHEGELFVDTGFWDTFRCLFAFVDLIYPEMGIRMQEGLVNHYLESGFLPEWSSPGHRGCMVGNNSASIVAEAYIKGLRGYDAKTLWKAVTHGAHAVHPQVSSSGRCGWEYYDALGYVPCDVDIKESAARTLEYAYDDWCIYKFGKALGISEEELKPYAKAAMNYRNLYRPEYGLMSGRKADGSFPDQFSPFKWGGDFTEGNSLHYTWSVFHDPAGLMDLMGGRKAFGAALDNVFELPPIFDESYYHSVIHEIREMQISNMGNYAHGNQPIQHMIYLYDWCGQPWKAQARIREVMDKLYSAAPDGYCGDEDNGQTSAWYIFSALGFYPVCPASAQYAIGTPLFQNVTVHLPAGDMVISAKDNSASSFYVESVRLDGVRHTRNYFTHEELARGAKISFSMSSHPNKSRGTSASDAPYSFSRE